MIKIEKTDVFGFDSAIRGMRNPMNSWEKSDSYWTHIEDPETLKTAKYEFFVGDSDLRLMQSLSKAGDDHGKFLRMINVTLDITAPLYWWKEFDTYKVGTVANSCSTMHKIHAKEFTLDDFSHDYLNNPGVCFSVPCANSNSDDDLVDYFVDEDVLNLVIKTLNHYRNHYLKTKDKRFWYKMIQFLPSSYNQKRTVQLNYQVLKSMYFARKDHKLDEWHTFCDWIETLPYFREICLED